MTEPDLSTGNASPSGAADRAGIALAAVCLVHCLALPLGLAVVPGLTIDVAVSETIVHTVLLAVALPVAAWALWLGMRRHRAWDLIALGGVGIALMFAGVAHVFGEASEAALTVVGVLLLLSAHVLNWRRCRGSATHCHDHHDHHHDSDHVH